MKDKYKNNPKIQEAARMYLAGDGLDEIGGKLGLSPMTVETYLHEAKVKLDEAKYHRITRSGKIVITSAGQNWAREWDAERLPLLVLMRYGG